MNSNECYLNLQFFPLAQLNFAYGFFMYSEKPRVFSIANSLKIVWYAPRPSRRSNQWRHQIFRFNIIEISSSIKVFKCNEISPPRFMVSL